METTREFQKGRNRLLNRELNPGARHTRQHTLHRSALSPVSRVTKRMKPDRHDTPLENAIHHHVLFCLGHIQSDQEVVSLDPAVEPPYLWMLIVSGGADAAGGQGLKDDRGVQAGQAGPPHVRLDVDPAETQLGRPPHRLHWEQFLHSQISQNRTNEDKATH